jgi:6-phosphogluconolactonase
MIVIYDDLESLSYAAAGLFVQQARQAVDDRGWFSVVLSGGHTPRRTYELLAQTPYRDRMPWSHVHVFWGDERCVPADDPRSNARMARQALLDSVPVPPKQIHPIPCASAPKNVAEAYELLLRDFFAGQPPCFDLVLLGLGENGHTASLFPGMEVLEERERWVAEVHVADQHLYRVTLTAPIINRASVVAFLVAGAGKAQVLKEVLEGPRDPLRWPAQLIQPTDGVLQWLVDRPASSLLTRKV